MSRCPPRSLSTRPPGICQTPGTIGVARALATQGLSDLGTALLRSICQNALLDWLKVVGHAATTPLSDATNSLSPAGEERVKSHGKPTNRIVSTDLPVSMEM